MSAKKFFRSLLFHFLLFLRIAYDWVVDFIISFIYDDSKVKKIPPVKESFLLDSAVTLAAKIRKKEVSYCSIALRVLISSLEVSWFFFEGSSK